MILSTVDGFNRSNQNCEVHRTLLESFTSLALSIVYPWGRGSAAYSPPNRNKAVPPVDSHHRSYRLNVPVTRQKDIVQSYCRHFSRKYHPAMVHSRSILVMVHVPRFKCSLVQVFTICRVLKASSLNILSAFGYTTPMIFKTSLGMRSNRTRRLVQAFSIQVLSPYQTGKGYTDCVCGCFCRRLMVYPAKNSCRSVQSRRY